MTWPSRATAERLTMLLLVVVAALTGTSGFLAVAAPSPSASTSPAISPAHPPASGPDQLVSADGRLTLTLPVEAGSDTSGMSIVQVLVSAPSVAAYELRPLHATFAAPVTATWRLDSSSAPPGMDGDLIWLAMASTPDVTAGPWAWLDDPHLSVLNGDYSITGQLTRFGTLIVIQLPTSIRGPEAIWGPGYAPARGIEVPLDLGLVAAGGVPSTAAFSGDWRFGGGYPAIIDVTTTVTAPDQLAAVWRCQRIGATSLATTFGVRQAATDTSPTTQILGLPPAAAAFQVAFPVTCGAPHPGPNG